MRLSWTQLEPLPQLGLLRTTGDVVWDCPEKGYWVLIDSGFYFDGASVPKWGWPLLLDASPVRLLVPGLVHDYSVRRDAVIHFYESPGHSRREPFVDADHAIDVMDDVMRWVGIMDSDRLAIRVALDATDRFYWHRKDVDWRGEDR